MAGPLPRRARRAGSLRSEGGVPPVARALRGPGLPRLTPPVPVHSQVLGDGLPAALRSLVDRHQANRAKTTADRSLARRLHDGVRQSGVAVGGLAFYVHDGAISVYGSVPDAAARDAVVAVAAGLPGVRRIVDHLRLAEA